MPVLAAAMVCLVVGVSDGDTLAARCDHDLSYERVTIRIAGIDAPEKAQPFGRQSKQHLSDLCYMQQATITPKTKDRYGRTVGDVECQGKDVATEQVSSGMAWVYDKYSKGYEHLYPLKIIAKGDRLGLWAQEAVAPWEWRKTQVEHKK